MRRVIAIRATMLAAVACVAGLASAPLRADLITNGGFETPAMQTSWGLIDLAPGSTGVIPWTVTNGEVLLLATTYHESVPNITFVAAQGDTALDITGHGNAGLANTIAQSIATVAGQNYVLSFALGNAYSTLNLAYRGTASVKVNVGSANGAVVSDQVVENGSLTEGTVDWQTKTIAFTANITGSTVVSFTNNTAVGTNYAGLDAVSVNATGVGTAAVPEPGVLTLASAGLPLFLGFAWFRRRLRR